YYKGSSYRLLAKISSAITYFALQKKLIDEYVRQEGKPDLVNVHICYKAGLGALYAKWRYGTRYVVSEQWTIFCPEAQPNFTDQQGVARWLMKIIYKNSSSASAVSHYLAGAIASRFRITAPLRIPNVVNHNIFYPSSDKHRIFTFIHVSVLNYQKSPLEILAAVVILKRITTTPFTFIIYGPQNTNMSTFITENGLREVVDHRCEVDQAVLGGELRQCHSLVLYSRFETFGCVVIEAMAAGLPVIVSDIPVMHELVEENVTGTFVPLDQPQMLAEKMLWMMNNYRSFDTTALVEESRKYSYERIGGQFSEWYNKVPYR
ncbi:MAG: glycosyltransferase, partial [Chitinophagaceae bacterium]